MKESLKETAALVGPHHKNACRALDALGGIYSDQGRYSEAEVVFAQQLAILRRISGPYHVTTGNCLRHLARVYSEQGRHSEAVAALERAERIWQQFMGADHPELRKLRPFVRLSCRRRFAVIWVQTSALTTVAVSKSYPASTPFISMRRAASLWAGRFWFAISLGQDDRCSP